MFTKVQSSVIILMIIMAIVVGLGGYAVLTFMVNRPDAPAGAIPQMVNDKQVMLNFDQEKTVLIVGQPGLPLGLDGTQGQDRFTGQNVIELQPQTPPEPIPEQPVVVVQEATPTEVPPPPLPTPVPEKIITIPYQVQANDSLYSISQRIDTSIALMATRGISAASLVPGAIIDLPVGNPAYCPGRRPYAVGEGDTAFSIGRRFGITAQDLQAINGLDANYTVRVADIICVP